VAVILIPRENNAGINDAEGDSRSLEISYELKKTMATLD